MDQLFKQIWLVVAFSFFWSAASVADVAHERQAMYQKIFDLKYLETSGSVTPIWKNDGSSFVYRSQKQGINQLITVNPVSGTKTLFLDMERAESALQKASRGSLSFAGEPFPDFQFVYDDAAIRFQLAGRGFLMVLVDYSITEISPEAVVRIKRSFPKVTQVNFPTLEVPRYIYDTPSPTGDQALVVQDHNLWARNFVDDRLSPITEDGVDRYAWTGGIWSPDGTVLLAYKTDTRSVYHMPVANLLKLQEEISYHMYPQAGGNLPQHQLHFVDVITGNLLPIEMGSDATYLRPAGWHPNGTEFLFFWLSRDGKQLELRAAHKTTGDVRVLWSEENRETFVLGTMQLYSGLAFRMLSDGRFIISSERTGWRHLYLYGPENGQIKQLAQLTNGEFPVMGLTRVDEEAGVVYFTAHSDEKRVYDTHLLRVGLDGNDLRQLTEATGEHVVQFAPSNAFYLDTHSTVARPPVTEIRRVSGEFVMVVEEADIAALIDLGWQAPEEFVVKAADGKTDLYGVIRKPWNFDPAKTYPVVEQIYGGPQRTEVVTNFMGELFSRRTILASALTQLGFITVSVDAPGTPGRGKAFQDAIYGNWGRYEIADHAAALKALSKTRPYMDMDRVGAMGISYGGYYTIRALLQAPGLYKVGVASMPVTHLHTNEASAVESYMGGRPQDVPQVYDYASNLPLVPQLKGKLLLIHPMSDVNAPFAHTVQLVNALIQAGKPHDINLVPEADHLFQYIDTQTDSKFREDTVRDYLVEHLLP